MRVISIAFPILILIIALFCILIPVMIGSYVYKDSKKRDMNSMLWTLIAVFAPGYLGFIVYLIARGENQILKCPSCDGNVRETFSVCPHCGTSLKSKCTHCGFPLENGWVACPNCSAPIAFDERTAPVIKEEKNDKTLRNILIAAIVVPLILCILLIFGLSFFRSSTPNRSSSVWAKDLTKTEMTSQYVSNWLQECDKTGKGIYVLKTVDESSETVTSVIVYRNDGYWDFEPYTESKTFKNDVLTFQFLENNADSSYEYTLTYFSNESEKECDIRICDKDGVNLDFDLQTVYGETLFSEGSANDESFCLDVEIPSSVTTVYSVSWTLYNDGAAITTESSQNADGSPFTKDTASFNYNGTDVNEFSFSLVDADGHTLFESEKFSIEPGAGYYFIIGYDSNGNLQIINDYGESDDTDVSVPVSEPMLE